MILLSLSPVLHRHISAMPDLFCWDGALANFLPGLASNRDPSDLPLLSSWDCRCIQTCLAGLRLIFNVIKGKSRIF
jgi:hypothetical protein